MNFQYFLLLIVKTGILSLNLVNHCGHYAAYCSFAAFHLVHYRLKRAKVPIDFPIINRVCDWFRYFFFFFLFTNGPLALAIARCAGKRCSSILYRKTFSLNRFGFCYRFPFSSFRCNFCCFLFQFLLFRFGCFLCFSRFLILFFLLTNFFFLFLRECFRPKRFLLYAINWMI